MNLNKDIFRKYDIRGIADIDFHGDFPYILGKAFGYQLLIQNVNGKLAVSGDVRPSTKRLKKEFIKGALSVGIDVIDIGILPTPTNYFSNYHFSDASVQITGSHNPTEYNGFKFTVEKKPFFGSQIIELYKIMLEKRFNNLPLKYSKIDNNIIMFIWISPIFGEINFAKIKAIHQVSDNNKGSNAAAIGIKKI